MLYTFNKFDCGLEFFSHARVISCLAYYWMVFGNLDVEFEFDPGHRSLYSELCM